ncbi:MAG: DNA-processing protein DprA, partial [Dongia sp.]
MGEIGDKERMAWLRLARSRGLGVITIRDLVAHFGSAAAALEALPDLAARGGRSRPLRLASEGEAEHELATLDKLGARLIARPESDYPEALAAIEDAPPVIAIRGRGELLAVPKVALVGARNASANGRQIARTMAQGLASAGFAVVSGMARGIDTAAHSGALEDKGGEGGTIAVVAGGIDVLYPPENAALFDRLATEGMILAEAGPGTEPLARHFPRRNRIVSGLSRAVVVVEAAMKSGSLITARYALENRTPQVSAVFSRRFARNLARLLKPPGLLFQRRSRWKRHHAPRPPRPGRQRKSRRPRRTGGTGRGGEIG